ncbi:hypothetical protein JD292_01000 [Leucobacter sp. CSA2]|uniref:Uncharacterized protein n=1 Tax=Leucobacter edaphi TaxID=2796472 RepID=A0A934QCB7_9MICO|nr:hypothetical protein [Leucobacter edaphi]MBK0420657.1 hypothetical protein [Leucobacter edaphi]
MTAEPRRGVTRGYVGGLLFAAVITAVALTVAGWGLLALFSDREPVSSPEVPMWAAPVVLFVALAMLAASLWQQALILLRGRRAPAWGAIIATAGGAYLLWCLGGILAGMSIEETWLSPFAMLLALAWGIASLLFWAVLARRVYTDRPAPKWPWEREDEDE